MKVLVVGAGGQLGQELLRSCPTDVDVVAADRERLDISDRDAVLAYVGECQPELIINAAAYTAVDGAEAEPDLALAINAEGPAALARAAEQCGARLFHVSTDFVFDGEATEPYKPTDDPKPLGVYGHSKLAGENRVREILPLGAVIVRTAWVYSSYGNNFVKTMLRLMSERDSLGVVDDQLGAPTWARGLAEVLWAFRVHPAAHGIYHWTDAGSCSWHEFAREIQSRAVTLGLLDRSIDIAAIPSTEFPTPARRPAYSVLDAETTQTLLNRPAVAWQDQLQHMLEDLIEE